MPDFADQLKPAEPSGSATLAKERAASDVPVQYLAEHLFARDDFLKRQDRVLQVLVKEPLLSKKSQQHMSRPDRYKLGLARAKLLRRMSDRLGWDHEDHRMADYLVDDVSPYFLNMTMFVTTVREQGSDEQKAHWLPLIESWKIIGAYAQTELGHGSNVRGLELRATWDPTTREFIFHSPTLTASKWWNGSLGRTATHSIVVAQLMLPDPSNPGKVKSFGPHPFIIRVRAAKTHKPLPGIIVGDIGPKYGYAPMDNAYMLFDNFRASHSALLSRYSHVDPHSGAFSSTAKSPAVVYGSLTFVRVNIVMHARLVLARAVTVACRYLSIRRQFADRDATKGTGEMQVLDYPTVQIRVLPLLATTYALHYTGIEMGRQYDIAREAISRDDFSMLADMHASSSGLKSLCTMLAADGIETCRRALGGHGFGGGSGLIQLNADYLSKPTVEGDNWMITQQMASYLIKKMQEAVNRKIKTTSSRSTNSSVAVESGKDMVETAFAEFIQVNNQSAQASSDLDILNSDEDIVQAFIRRSAYLAYNAHNERNVERKPWTSMMVQLHKLSTAHSQALLVRNFYSALFPNKYTTGASPAQQSTISAPSSYSTAAPSKPTATDVPAKAHPVLLTCFRLFALNTMQNNGMSFLSSSAVSLSTLKTLPIRIQQLMAELRPHAVNLVDAWSVPDYLLDSALGRYDGNVYEDLFDRAHRQNPLNAITVNPYYWDEEIEMGAGAWRPKL